MKINFKKITTILLDLALAVYLVFAFTAFNKPNEEATKCEKVTINIADESTNGFISTDEIVHRLKANKVYPYKKTMSLVDTRRIEEVLKQSPFVKTAECYKTINGKVSITISQLTPIIRIKASSGDDYYIDNKDCVMPNSSYTSDLIICTGNITRSFATGFISPLAAAIMDNDMWRNQIEQINVLADRSIEIVPRIGDHVVCLGQLPSNSNKEKQRMLIKDFLDKKMKRLMLFYKYGLSKAGWNKYSYINLEFDNQIICKRRHK
ncbi:MAG: cell division protein FtsQ [Prevotella sp.]|nr:cell division protein FtsQ [Prevotella sp.]